ncbi:Zona pellucida sperm-binding protein 1 [Saguinus oedipus]|uniref:Zona pellucida sperm-binding protein 1 n=1 Tax=Saguinus oedipus TaxID=9490 RepID=A0ABQ9UUA3_SAGOE|nr:Zona pellucida sperm-binding protein 1 [Saguinus oedipus]
MRGTSKEACQQAGCCYDNTTEVPCYYGNTGTTSHTSTILVPWILKQKDSHLLQLVEAASHPPPGEPNSQSRWQKRPLDEAIICPSWLYNNGPGELLIDLPLHTSVLSDLKHPGLDDRFYAIVQCFRDGYFILMVSQEIALTHRITLANVYLAYTPTSCSPTQDTDAFVVFQFPVTHCGTTVQVAGDQLVYENWLVASIHIQKGPQGSIMLHVCCVFNASDFLPVQASIFPTPLPAPVTQPGPCGLSYGSPRMRPSAPTMYGEDDYPIVRLLREPVHVEVRLLQRTDPKLVLLLHQCWGAPSANPFQQPQWPILSDGYRTQMVALDRATPFQSHYQRFTVATFALLDSGSQRAL